MRRNWIVVATAFACAALLTANGFTAEEPKKDDKAPTKVTKDEVKEKMIKVHRGEKSPLGRTTAELKKETPDWEQLAKDVKDFAGMGKSLAGAGLYTDPARYIASTTTLSKAIGEKDKKAATEAFTGLGKSCSSCHYGKPK